MRYNLRIVDGTESARQGEGWRLYRFDEQLERGEQGEALLDRHFSRWFRIARATPGEQRQGIDRWFYALHRPSSFAVEYKTDWTAAQTGNAFIETISVDTRDRDGWAYTSAADVLLYYVPGRSCIYVLTLTALRFRLPFWQQQYPVREIPNSGYHTHGLLVPLTELEGCAQRVLTCKP